MSPLLDTYCRWLTSWGASERTIGCRREYLARHLASHPAGATQAELIDHLANYSGWTAYTYYSHLSSFYGWAVDSGAMETNPMRGMRRPRHPRQRPRPLTADEAQRALEAATGNARAFLILAMRAGLRAHEIAKIRGEDVTADAIYVTGKGGKTAMIPTHPHVWELAQHYPRRGPWFPGRAKGAPSITPHAVSVSVARLFTRLGIDGSVHRCRHYYGTTLLRGGANLRVVQTLMRHDSLATTAGYLGVDEDERRTAILGLVA